MKVKKTVKKSSVVKKKITTSTRPKSEKPWVKVLNMDVNPDNPKNGFFELGTGGAKMDIFLCVWGAQKWTYL